MEMPTTRSVSPSAEDPSRKWQLVERIVASSNFVRAPQLCEFLLFVARRALIDGRQDVTESEIARTALGRGADFDPKEDNIVRVQAHQLRARLEDYFKNEGLDEPVILTIPKRSYLPQLTRRRVEVVTETTPQLLPPPSRLSRRGVRLAWLAAAILLVGAMALFLLVRWRTNRSTDLLAGIHAAHAENLLLDRVFHSGKTTTIVVADGGLTLVQEMLHVPISLDEYVQRGFDDKTIATARTPEMQDLLRAALVSDRTSVAATAVATELGRQSTRYGAGLVVRSAKQIHISDLRAGDFIMIGGPRAVPWVSLFESHLNFRIRGNAKTLEYWIENVAPAAGEQKKYSVHQSASTSDTFATVAVLPGPSERTNVLLLAGLDTQGTEAAGRFLEQGTLPQDVAGWLRNEGHSAELLLQSRSISNEVWDVKLIAYRKIDSGPRPALPLPD